MVSWQEEDPKCEEDKLGDRIEMRGRKRSGNRKEFNQNWTGTIQYGRWDGVYPRVKTGGGRRHQSREVSVEPANLLRWLKATFLCHPPSLRG